jgi:hypothetical protein
MKKLIITLIALVCFIPAQAQWVTKIIDNGFDGKFKVAYVESTTGKEFVKLYAQGDGTLGFLLYEGFICTDRPIVELTFLVGGEWQSYEAFRGSKSTDSEKVYMLDDITAIEEDFRKATIMKVRLNDDHCGTEIFEFNMSGSGKAIDFMKTP